jgi:hypothetical protein
MSTETYSPDTKDDAASRGDRDLKVAPALLKQAKQSRPAAIETMFRQFLSPDEAIQSVEYLGYNGLFGLGHHSFGCLTDKRICSIRVGSFGEVVYQDGYLEHINSGVVYQPSKLMLYVLLFIFAVVWLGLGGFAGLSISGLYESVPFGAAVGVLIATLGVPLMSMVVRFYYALHKCGLVFVIREGVSVYMFTNRRLLVRANRMYRTVTNVRDARLQMPTRFH